MHQKSAQTYVNQHANLNLILFLVVFSFYYFQVVSWIKFVLIILFSSSWIHLSILPFMFWLFLLWLECHIVCMINISLKMFLIKLFALLCSIDRMNVLYFQLPMEARMLQ
jgi:hypothetical protein